MRRSSKRKIIVFLSLMLIFLSVLCTRYYFFSQSSQFSDDGSYYVLRQVENIVDTGKPLYDDPLSYGGREFFFTPLYHYLLAGLFFLTESAFSLKILNNIFASTIIISAYLLTRNLTRNDMIAYMASFLSGFIPIFFKNTLNSLNPYSLFFPVLLLLLYYISLLKRDSKKYSGITIFLFIILIFLSPLSLILIFGLLFNQILVKVDGNRINKKEIEIFLTSFLFYLWYYFIIYKKTFFDKGFSIIKQNIPENLILDYFSTPSPINMLLLIGVIPFLIGSYALYNISTKKGLPHANILASTIIMIMIFSFLDLITLNSFIMIFGVLMTVISAVGIKIVIDYFLNVKIRFFKTLVTFMIMILVLPSFLMAINVGFSTMDESIDEDDLLVFRWMDENIPENMVVAASIPDGHLITYYAKRENIVDSNFLMLENIDQRIRDIRTIYTSPFYSDVIKIAFEKYGSSYVLVNDRIRDRYGIEGLRSFDETCFQKVYENQNNDEVYQIIC